MTREEFEELNKKCISYSNSMQDRWLTVDQLKELDFEYGSTELHVSVKPDSVFVSFGHSHSGMGITRDEYECMIEPLRKKLLARLEDIDKELDRI